MNRNLIKEENDPFTVEGIHYATGKNVRIEIENGIIGHIEESSGIEKKSSKVFISPGLIDNQLNGYQGIDFSDDSFTSEGMKIAIKSIWRDGVTTFLPTLITNSHPNLIRNFKVLAESLKDNSIAESIPGFHLEGPYLSTETGFFGCHPVSLLRKPSWDEFSEYQAAAGGKIIQVTIAPELEGAMDFIEKCTQNGIHVSLGHTNATKEQIYLAVEKGARSSTHLGNGCANFINRHKNPLWPQLANELLTPSIIADGHHLLPEEIEVFYKVKGPENLIITSDVNHLIGMPPGDYFYMGSAVTYTEDGLVKNTGLNCLAGASMPLKRGVETMMNYTGCTLGEAINLASRNVAKVYNLNDRGTLTPGKRADLILFEKEGNKLIIKSTYLGGKLVYQKNRTNELTNPLTQ